MNGTEEFGHLFSDGDLTQMVERIDVNGDMCIDIDEFSELYQTIMDSKDEEENMKGAFNVFDRNGDGYISVDKLRSVLESMGLKQGKAMEDCKRMITKVDLDGDGRVNFMEFKQMMKGGGFSVMA
ncbi:CALMODULIN LIKE 7, ROOT HAIR SPECIFIC 1 [Hibiscus trionum]|uniref:CALMODULIN LIKE 7, ROOT HAIR SPECIFIC 1 n=1 Tax=Hibiscus trionum TaxID=183268 RepID=A0A9W7H284_HIBTR|nr:CALMODULIN LIKE 7, ROOT HAIR SPECIFIC 1 [Hibiscus trionum]